MRKIKWTALLAGLLLVGCGTTTATVTRTVSVPAPQAQTPQAPSPSASRSWSGQGDKSFGTVEVSRPSTLKWTCSGECNTFNVSNSGRDDVSLEVSSSDQASGDTVMDPGTYHAVHVITSGTWTIKIVPNG